MSESQLQRPQVEQREDERRLETCSVELASSYHFKEGGGGKHRRGGAKYIEPPCRAPSTPLSTTDALCITHNNVVRR